MEILQKFDTEFIPNLYVIDTEILDCNIKILEDFYLAFKEISVLRNGLFSCKINYLTRWVDLLVSGAGYPLFINIWPLLF